MGTKVMQRGQCQIIVTAPDPMTIKRGKNPVTERLAGPETRNRGKAYRENKQLRSLSKTMNCQNIEKFEGDHAPYPKAKFARKRKLPRKELRVWILAGAVVDVDPWAFTRMVVYNGDTLGTCTDGDLAALVNSGYAQAVTMPNGYKQYIRA